MLIALVLQLSGSFTIVEKKKRPAHRYPFLLQTPHGMVTSPGAPAVPWRSTELWVVPYNTQGGTAPDNPGRGTKFLSSKKEEYIVS